jgi:hypothetical protein
VSYCPLCLQAVTKNALAVVDGSPQSMLAIVGETNVAGLAEVSQRTTVGPAVTYFDGMTTPHAASFLQYKVKLSMCQHTHITVWSTRNC